MLTTALPRPIGVQPISPKKIVVVGVVVYVVVVVAVVVGVDVCVVVVVVVVVIVAVMVVTVVLLVVVVVIVEVAAAHVVGQRNATVACVAHVLKSAASHLISLTPNRISD